MKEFPQTIVIRHRKENLKKCSLRGLEKRPDFLFFTYPLHQRPAYDNYILLTVDATEELSVSDKAFGLLILDATWKYAQQMERHLPAAETLKKRRLPKGITTAYPRYQTGCPEPAQGLASIEAIVCAYALMQRPLEGLLNHYYWKDSFLEKNRFLLSCLHA